MSIDSERIELSKERASIEACEILKELDRLRVIGLGTGSTVRKFIDVCHGRLREKHVVVSSTDTALYAKTRGLSTIDPYAVDEIDLYIDGADEVSRRLDLVKGRGGALLREKTLAYLSKTRIYIVDFTKYSDVDYLFLKPIPIEIVPFALIYVMKVIKSFNDYEASIRTGDKKDGPVLTDNGNYIIDLVPKTPLRNPREHHFRLKSIHGVVETGIFPAEDLVDMVIVGYPDRATRLERG